MHITLAGKNYPIAPLTLGDMRRAGPAFTRIGVDTPEAMSAQITLIYLAMHSADHNVTPADVDGITGVTIAEIQAAVEMVARLIGVALVEASPLGEALPAKGPAGGEALPAKGPAGREALPAKGPAD